MAYVNDMAHFAQNALDSLIGRETYRYRDSVSGETVVKFVIKPAWDLVIQHDVEIQLTMPAKYKEIGGIVLKVLDERNFYLFKDRIRTNGELLFDWERSAYDVPVWFFAVRGLLRHFHTYSWRSACQLDSEFRRADLDWPKSFIRNSDLHLVYGSGRTRGKRNYMEDVDFVINSIEVIEGSVHRDISIFGVLDGHGGKECADFVAESIPLRTAALLRSNLHIPDAIHQAFLETDKEFLSSPAGMKSGCTANILFYDHEANVFYIGNTGDTRAVLCRAGRAFDLSIDRKSADPEEIARMAESGGFVVNGRAMGSLAVSRSLGDIQLKEEGRNKLNNIVIPDPEISTCYPTSKDDFLLIASDGLWDVMTSQAAVDYASEKLKAEGVLDGGRSISALGEDIVSMRVAQVANNIAVNASSKLNSMDNVTVMIILLIGGPLSCPADHGSIGIFSKYIAPVEYSTRTKFIESPINESDSALLNLNHSISGRISSLLSKTKDPSNSPTLKADRGKGDIEQKADYNGKGGLGSLSHRLNFETNSGNSTNVAESNPTAFDTADYYSSDKNTQTMIFKQGSATSISTRGEKQLCKISSSAVVSTARGPDDAGVDDLLDFLEDDSNF